MGLVLFMRGYFKPLASETLCFAIYILLSKRRLTMANSALTKRSQLLLTAERAEPIIPRLTSNEVSLLYFTVISMLVCYSINCKINQCNFS